MHREIATNTKPTGITSKVKTKAANLAVVASTLITYAACSMSALAVNIKHDYTVKDPGTNFNPEGLILGLAFWIARLVGIGMLVWGIYGYVTARKDGEAESMNGAIGKLISGVVLIAMPSVLTALGII